MVETSVAPATYNSLLAGFTREQQWIKADCLLAQLLQTHSHDSKLVSVSFSSVISSYGKAGQFESMERLLSLMLNEGCSPTTATFNAIITTYGKSLRIQAMEAALYGMADSGLEPNVVTWSCLADAYRRAKLHSKVDAVLEKLLKRDDLDVKAYGLMIDIYGRRRDFQQLERCYKGMVDAGLKPDVMTWTSIVSSYSGGSKADEIWNRVVSSSELEPDVPFYLSLLCSYRENGSWKRLEDVFVLIKRSSTAAKTELVKAYNIVLDAYGSRKLVWKMEKTWEDMENKGLEADSLTYTALIAGYAKAKMVKRMESTFLRLRVAGCASDEFVFSVLINGYASLGMVEEAENTLNDMLKVGLEPSLVELTSVLNSYKNSGRHRALARRFLELQQVCRDKFRPDERTMAVFLSALKASTSAESTLELLECVRQCDHSGTVTKLLKKRRGDSTKLSTSIKVCHEYEDVEEGEDGLWNGVRDLLTSGKNSDLVCDSLVDALVLLGHRRRASKLLEVACECGSFPRLQRMEADALVLDLHGLSVRVAEVALMLWFSRLRSSLGGESSPCTFGSWSYTSASIVTGWGRSSRDFRDSPVKKMVAAILSEMRSPFRWDNQNEGRLTATVKELKKWMREEH